MRHLPPKMKSDLKKGRYFIDEQGIIQMQHEVTRNNLIVLPPEHRKAFLHYYHHNVATGLHASTIQMAKELIRRYYWPGYWADIKEYVSTCHSCQINEAARSNKKGKLKLFTPNKPNQMWAIDHKGPINPATKRRNRYITSIIDRFSGKV